MDKTAIKKFAIKARRQLIDEVTQKSFVLGIEEKKIHEIETFQGGFRVQGRENGRIFKEEEVLQRKRLVEQVKAKGFHQVMEEVAYTWFKRFIAIRFMEINDYLPTGVRVLSSVIEGMVEPDIVKEALSVDLDVDRDLVLQLKEHHQIEDLFKYLLIKQCNQLGEIMPTVFEGIAEYTELLLPENLIGGGSVIRDLVRSVDEYDWKIDLDKEEKALEGEKGEHGIEIIGWLYQYYISEKKDEIFKGIQKNIKISKENIPAATQLFTPKWIVKYMVENSLGRLWLESHPCDNLKKKWKYYLDETEQEPEVYEELEKTKNSNLKPEELVLLDPAMGSGHILVYAFDLLYDIYLSKGYSEKEVPTLILEKNLYGLDIDDRSKQLASFALYMKARSKSSRLFREKQNLNVCSIEESNGITRDTINFFANNDDNLKEEVITLVSVFKNAKNYGSIIDVKNLNIIMLKKRIEEILNRQSNNILEDSYKQIIRKQFIPLIVQSEILCKKFDIVFTNPPYIGHKQGMNKDLSRYINERYSDAKYDIYAVFINRCIEFLKDQGLASLITQHTWMFLGSYKKFRTNIIKNNTIINLIHLGPRAFEEISGEVVQTVSFVLKKISRPFYRGTYIGLTYENTAYDKHLAFFKNKNRFITTQNKITYIEGSPIVYWVNDSILSCFEKYPKLINHYRMKNGPDTKGKNTILFKFWYEVDYNSIGFNLKEYNHKYTWFPLNKGGTRKWYGDYLYVAKNEFACLDNSFFNSGITWSDLSSKFNCRYSMEGFVFNNHGKMLFEDKKKLLYPLGFLNSVVANRLVHLLTVKTKYEIGYVGKLPFNSKIIDIDLISKIVEMNLHIAKLNWDNQELSWNYRGHFLNKEKGVNLLNDLYRNWYTNSENQFNQLKQNEEELNRIFIEIYGLEDELTPEVPDKDITINKADKERDIKSFLSYAVGCMFGRYSLDKEGLVYAGGDFNDIFRDQNGSWEINTSEGWRPSSIPIVGDNILPITEGDYFEEDILSRCVDFLKVTFGEDALEENLDYIADSIGRRSKETAREAIRRYFLKGFYKDHVRIYKKRPIYWMFTSGRQNGFKALIYMHRYDPNTVARARVDYLHQLQKKYEAEINHLGVLLDSNLSTREKGALRKLRESAMKKQAECRIYDEVIAHVANQHIAIDLDDGVKVNYSKFQSVEIPRGEGKKPLKSNLLEKI